MVLHPQESTFEETGSHKEIRDVSGDPVVKTPCFHCGGHGFVSGWETKILHATRHGHKKKKKERKKEIKNLSLNGYTQTQSISLCKSSSTSATSREPTNTKGRREGRQQYMYESVCRHTVLTINITYHAYPSPVL